MTIYFNNPSEGCISYEKTTQESSFVRKGTTKELVQDHLNVGPELINELRKEKWPVVKYDGLPKSPGQK
ncbi:hypothetical protein [Neobacillus drentensis]|uniref:hypothetical protein n=1 Tax=Neobacillus drentensis TaxID=220684 RepID=UPI002FFD8F80